MRPVVKLGLQVKRMRIVLTRVSGASVTIDGQVTGEIGRGFLVLVGITHTDTEKDVAFLAEKCCGLRVFEDADGKMNRSLQDVGGALLIVSNFTLYGQCKKGKRPSFTDAARPEVAQPLYDAFIAACRSHGVHTQTGRFGADMQLHSVNDGPVTLILES